MIRFQINEWIPLVKKKWIPLVKKKWRSKKKWRRVASKFLVKIKAQRLVAGGNVCMYYISLILILNNTSI